MQAEATVFLVDDDPDLRRSMSWLLHKAGLRAQTFSSAEDFLQRCDRGRPGCVLLDLRMPGMSGLDLQRRMAADSWGTPVIIVSGHGDVAQAVQAMEAGAIGFMEKPFSRRDLLDRVQEALAMDARWRFMQSRREEAHSRLESLTPREREVMRLVVQGGTTKSISRLLGTSVRTIEVHRSRIIKKTQADSIAELVMLAVRAGIVHADAAAGEGP